MHQLDVRSILGQKHVHASLHDAKFHSVSLDFVHGIVDIDCTLWIGDLDAKSEEEREATAKGVLRFHEMRYCIMDPEVAVGAYEDGFLDISADGPISELKSKPDLPELDTEDLETVFVHWFFATNCNGFFYLAAKRATFEWVI